MCDRKVYVRGESAIPHKGHDDNGDLADMTFELENSWTRWRWGLIVAAAITLIGVYPLFLLPLIRGKEWNGSFPYLQGDEVMYAAYANALRDGHARRNNPYIRDEDRPGKPLEESSCSIQFVPAYAIAFEARRLQPSQQ
jgi:hypothetical protein